MNQKQSTKYNGSVADLFDNFKLSGRAICSPRPQLEYEVVADIRRRELNKIFPGNENKANRRRKQYAQVDKISVIRKYHEIYLKSRFPWGVPDNFLTGPKVVALANSSNGKRK